MRGNKKFVVYIILVFLVLFFTLLFLILGPAYLNSSLLRLYAKILLFII